MRFFQVGIACFHIIERCIKARVKGQIKLLRGVLCQRYSGSRCLCVVDKHLNPTKSIHSLSDNICNDSFIVPACTDIRLHGQDFDSVVAFQLLLGIFQLFQISTSDNKVCTLFGISCGDSIADGAAASILQNSTSCTCNDCSFSS